MHVQEEEEELYVMPAMDEEDLYSQLDTIRIESLSRKTLRYGNRSPKKLNNNLFLMHTETMHSYK